MARYTILPTCQARPSVEMIADNAVSALHMAGRMDFRDADVRQDGEYIFSLRAAVSGFWVIFQREEIPTSQSVA